MHAHVHPGVELLGQGYVYRDTVPRHPGFTCFHSHVANTRYSFVSEKVCGKWLLRHYTCKTRRWSDIVTREVPSGVIMVKWVLVPSNDSQHKVVLKPFNPLIGQSGSQEFVRIGLKSTVTKIIYMCLCVENVCLKHTTQESVNS